MAQNKISPALSIWLDAIRGLAAVEVFLGHLRPVCFETNPQLPGLPGIVIKTFYFSTSLAHEAVVIFFVLSGFLVGGSVLAEFRETSSIRLWPYVAARVARIHSVLIPALLLGGALDAAGIYGLHASNIYEHGHFHGILWWSVSQGLSWQAFLASLASADYLHSIVWQQRPVVESGQRVLVLLFVPRVVNGFLAGRPRLASRRCFRYGCCSAVDAGTQPGLLFSDLAGRSGAAIPAGPMVAPGLVRRIVFLPGVVLLQGRFGLVRRHKY